MPYSPSFCLHSPQPPRGLLDRHASRITTTRFYLLRQAVFLVKLAAGLCWGADPAVRARLAMAPYPADPGTWVEGAPKKRLPIAKSDEAREGAA